VNVADVSKLIYKNFANQMAIPINTPKTFLNPFQASPFFSITDFVTTLNERDLTATFRCNKTFVTL